MKLGSSALAALTTVCIAFSVVRVLPSDGAGAPAPSFTPDQARKGQTLFYEHCAECHGANLQGQYGPALSGPGGNLQWQPVKQIYAYAVSQMPAGNAGGLPPGEYVEIMAFLMQSHGHRPGSKPLTQSAATTSTAVMGP
ncbi:MAG TPA: c-type cytochrome [Candidatus Baltobacteraceae bacterium]|jgi:mono/diheme cytochrome c family protein